MVQDGSSIPLRDGPRVQSVAHNICVAQKGNRGYANCCVYEFYSKLRDDAIDYIRQLISLRPPVNRREARAFVETVGSIPVAMEHIVPSVPPVPYAIFIYNLPPPAPPRMVYL